MAQTGEEQWPKSPAPTVLKIEEKQPEEAKVIVINTTIVEPLYTEKEEARFDKFERFVRVTAWVMRAFRVFRSKLKKYKEEKEIYST